MKNNWFITNYTWKMNFECISMSTYFHANGQWTRLQNLKCSLSISDRHFLPSCAGAIKTWITSRTLSRNERGYQYQDECGSLNSIRCAPRLIFNSITAAIERYHWVKLLFFMGRYNIHVLANYCSTFIEFINFVEKDKEQDFTKIACSNIFCFINIFKLLKTNASNY